MAQPHLGQLKIITGNANPALAEAVCSELKLKLCEAKVGAFANGEISIKVTENVRGDDVFVFQPTCSNEGVNVNTAVMELLLLIHTLKLASVRRVIAIIPQYGYGRQDRKHTSRVPISASAIAKMITELGASGVVTVDLHCSQIQGFFHALPVADLTPSAEFAEYALTKNFNLDNVVVVAPDAGAVARARRLADKIGVNRIVTILKRRVEANMVDSMQLVGNVKGFTCIIVDDMIDTAGTLVKAAEVLANKGAAAVHAWATHGILTDPACARINSCAALHEVVVTDSMSQAHNLAKCSKLRIISIAKLLAEAIKRLHNEESMEHVGETPVKTTQDPVALEADANDDDWKNFPK